MNVRTARLGEICEINPRAPKSLEDGTIVSFLSMSSVSEDGFIAEEQEREAGQVREGYSFFERGDILVAKITPCFENGKATRTSSLRHKVGFGSTEFHVLRASNEVLPEYVFHSVWNSSFREVGVQNMTGSAGQKRIPTDFIRRLEIPLPPLDEQRRIAAILDKADALRRKRKRALALLDGLTQSIFLEMFGDPSSNPRKLRLGQIGDMLEHTQYETSAKAGNSGSHPILRMGNITNTGHIVIDDLKYIDLTSDHVERYTVRRGDILFNRTNSVDLVGKTAVFQFKNSYAYAGYLVRARTRKGVSPEYVSSYLNSPHGKATLRGMAKSIVGMANINAREMQNIPILIPSESDQLIYQARLNVIAQKTSVGKNIAQVAEHLFTSLQHRAFTGQL